MTPDSAAVLRSTPTSIDDHTTERLAPKRRRRSALALLAALVIGVPTAINLVPGADAGPRNLLTSGQQTFEKGLDRWQGQDGTQLQRSRNTSYAGRYSMRLQTSTRTVWGARNAVATTPIGRAAVAVRPGASYSGTIQARSGARTQRNVECDLVWYRNNGSLLNATAGGPVAEVSGGWSSAQCSGVAPTGAAFVALRVVVQGAAAGERHFVDEAWLVDTTPGGGTPAPTPTTAPPAPAPAPAAFAQRIDAASMSDVVAPDGTRFVADRDFFGGSGADAGPVDVAGTENDALYRTHRWGMAGYAIAVPAAGAYTVRLHFAEPFIANAGGRVFDVSAEGATRIDDLDVFARVGLNRALVLQFDVAVSDGTLNLGFAASADDPMVSGLEVLSSGTSTSPPTTSPPTTAPPTTAPPATVPPATVPPATVPPAPSTGFPDASNTGPSATLTPSGPITTSADGQVIQNVEVRGDINVVHSNVVIRNVRVVGGVVGINESQTGARNLLIEDCELNGGGLSASAIAEHNYTMRRCDVHGYAEGPRINGNVVLEDNYFHDFANFIAQGAHQDCIQATSGFNVVIRHNNCDMNVDGANSSIFFSTHAGGNVLIENNLVAGGSWAIGVDGQLYSGVTIRGNRFSTRYHPTSGYYGAIATNGGNVTLGDNLYYDGPNTGQPVGPPSG